MKPADSAHNIRYKLMTEAIHIATHKVVYGVFSLLTAHRNPIFFPTPRQNSATHQLLVCFPRVKDASTSAIKCYPPHTFLDRHVEFDVWILESYCFALIFASNRLFASDSPVPEHLRYAPSKCCQTNTEKETLSINHA